ncbi:MAG TPA: fibronectin type III domain-containing protein [bacterium]|nr:fibronectin type III domain-containing protein [bacterium]
MSLRSTMIGCVILILAAVHSVSAQGNILREMRLDSLGQGVSISEPGTALLEIISTIDDTLRFDSNMAKKLSVERMGNRYLVTCPALRQIITIMADGFMNLNIPLTLEANKSYTAKIGIKEEAADAITDVAMPVSDYSAILKGLINPKGLTTNTLFEYGPNKQYGMSISGSPSPVSGMRSYSINAVIEDLEPGILYHFRIVAKNKAGTTYGDDQTFSTSGRKPLKEDKKTLASSEPKVKSDGIWSRPYFLPATGGAALGVAALMLRSSANASYESYQDATTSEAAAKFRDETEKKDTYTAVAAGLSGVAVGYSVYKWFKYRGEKSSSPVSLDLQSDGHKTQVSLAIRLP